MQLSDESEDRVKEEEKAAKDMATLARGVGVNLLALFSRFGRPLFYLIAARLYATETYGLYFLAWTYVDLGSRLASFGLDKGLLRYVAYHNSFGDERRAAGCVRTALLIGGVLSVAVSLGFFLFSGPLAVLVGKKSLAVPFRWMAFVVFFQTMSGLLLQVPIAHKIMEYQLYIKGLLEPFLLIGIAVLFSILGFGLAGLCAAHLIVVAIVFCCSIVPALKLVPLRLWAERGARLEREILRFSFSMFLANNVANLNNRLDVIMLGFFASPKLIGVYGIALQLASVIPAIRFAFDAIANPFFTELHARKELSRLAEIYKLITRWIILITFPLILLFVLSGSGIAALIGKDYAAGYPWLLILLIGSTVAAFWGLSGYVLAMTGHPGSLLGINLVTLLLTGPATYLLVRWLGPPGAAASASLRLVLTNTLACWWVYRLFKIHPFSTRLWKPLGAGLFSAVLIHVLHPLLPGASLWSVLPLLLGLYTGLLLCFGLEEEERKLANKITRRLKRLSPPYRKEWR